MKQMPEDEIFRTTLPPGRHRLPRDFVARHQRDRLFAAIVQLVDEQGYPATSLTQIVKKAGIARHTFYEHYEGKEQLFLAVFEAASGRAIAIGREAAEASEGTLEQRLIAGTEALLRDIAQAPSIARVCLTEALSASPETLVAYERGMHAFAEMLREGGRGAAGPDVELPDSLEDILVGGVVWMIGKRLSGDPDSIAELLPGIIEFVVGPYLGEPAARRAAKDARARLAASTRAKAGGGADDGAGAGIV